MESDIAAKRVKRSDEEEIVENGVNVGGDGDLEKDAITTAGTLALEDGTENGKEEGSPVDVNEGKKLKYIFDILIPKEVTSLIFNRLESWDIQDARLVSKRWCSLIDPTLKWRPYLYDKGIAELKTFIKKGFPIDQLNVSKLQDFVYPENGMGFSQVRSIHFLPYRDRTSDAKDYKGISGTNFTNLLKDLKNVEELRLHSMALNDVPRPSVLTSLDFPALKELQISTLDTDGPGFHVCLDVLDNMFPSLEKLSAMIFFDIGVIQHPPRYRDVFQFVIRHKETLRTFHLDYSASSQPHPISLMFDHDIPTDVFERMMTELKSVQLDEFLLSPSFYEGNNRFIFASSLLGYQKHLTVLNVQHLSQWNRPIWTAIQEVILVSFATLKKIICRGCFCPLEGATHETFSCLALSNCSLLTDLQISVCGLQVVDIHLIPKSVIVLDLGVHLHASTISYVSGGHFKDLQEWIIRATKRTDDSPVPGMTLLLLTNTLRNLPSLKKLVIFKKNSEWKKIKKFIGKMEGLSVEKCPEEMEMVSGFAMITINRLQFNQHKF